MSLPARFRALLTLMRPMTLVAPIAVTPLVAYAAIGSQLVPNWERLLYAAVTLVLCNIAANMWNASADFEVDRLSRPDRPVASGQVTEAEARWIGYGVAIFALLRAMTINIWFGALIMVILVSSWLYSYRLKPRKITSWVALGFVRGGLGPLAAWSAFAAIDPRILSFALVAGIYSIGAWSSKDIGDSDQDRMTWLIILWGVFLGLTSAMLAGLLLSSSRVAAAVAAATILTWLLAILTDRQFFRHPAAWYGAYLGLLLVAVAFALG